MNSANFRIEHDSMGALQVPADALYGAQTQRAIENFPISGQPLPAALIQALGAIKAAAAIVNRDLGLLAAERADAISAAALQIAAGQHLDQFPIDTFQTGSGTSSNMNANEVIARLASDQLGSAIHPNNDVNMGQSSNDVFPSALQLAAVVALQQQLLPALHHLGATLRHRTEELAEVIKTGRTHLMDAMPVRMGQELSGWRGQIEQAICRIESSLPRLSALPMGGTAVGTGINTHPQFGLAVVAWLQDHYEIPLSQRENLFEGLSSQDSAVEMSGQLKTLAVALLKISNDLRWMNSGPLAGLGEISLPALQPGSSIMPGKVNPVIPEAVMMVAAQVIGNDSAITVGGQHGNFQLNVMLPMIGSNLLRSIELLASAARVLADKAIAGFVVNQRVLQQALARNPILVTALNREIGYEQGAAIAKRAYAEGRPVIDVALEMTDLSRAQLEQLLDPARLTEGGV